ncbi:MAG: TonB-dependent receptor [Acidobacteriota bacterium]|nr:TonB-dependent receptor [Acidobacteriota bacterium]
MKNNIKVFAVALFAICSLLFATAAMAQTNTTGSIEGTVKDINGAVVPNASITISGGNLIRPQTTTSDAVGNYRFSQVPPGVYTVKATGTGFNEFSQESVAVNLSRVTSLDIQFAVKGSVNTVDVVAGGGAGVDVTDNTSGTNVSTEFFSNFPTSRTVQGLYTIAPTVARSGLRDASGRDRDPSVAGSSGPENNYILDGVTTTDPAFGGSGANLPFEFVQEVEIKTGSYGADQGLSTGGIFNVITKSGTNNFHGDVFTFFSDKSLVRKTKNFSNTGASTNGFSEVDAGVDVSGPVIKNKLTFFAAFNPQFRKNFFLTQTLRVPVESKIKTPFYAGKLTYLINNNNTFTFSTFGDYTTQKGFLFGNSGFGANTDSFRGTIQTGGSNYAFRLNSAINQNNIGEFSFGLHRQRNNTIPASSVANKALISDNFAILNANGTVANVTQSGVNANAGFNPATTDIRTLPNQGRTGFVDYVFAPGGTLQRGFVRDGFGLFSNQKRNRLEGAAKMQSIYREHTFKYGFEFFQNKYIINTTSTGPSQTFANPLGLGFASTDNNQTAGFRATNNYSVCTTRTVAGVGTIVCPSSSATAVFNALPVAARPTGFTANAVTGAITVAEANKNPFLVRLTTRIRDFKLNANTKTNVESFYFQDDWKVIPSLQFNIGVRWDLQQAKGNGGITYLKLNNLFDDLQPRLGVIYDFTGKGKGKVFANYARYVETPLPLDINVRAGSLNSQTDKNFNASTFGGASGATIVPGIRGYVLNANGTVNFAATSGAVNLGADPTPIDPGLKPQSVNEWNVGGEYQFMKNYTFGVRGIYRAQGSVIEDGSFDDGDHYFLFNPGEIRPSNGTPESMTTEEKACNMVDIGCFGRARRYYRALEFTLNRRFANSYQFSTSYVRSSLTGNYEGLFRNDNGQSDPNITSLFDLVSLLQNEYGRLPNDRPHQFKFNGTYTTPFKLIVSGNFYAQSGIPFNALIPHPVYGNNEGFLVQRGTAIIPTPTVTTGIGGLTGAIGKNRSPFTYNLDLGAIYPIQFSESKQLRLSVDWFNVLNVQRAVTLDQTFTINSGVTGIAPITNPFFGLGNIFQTPSALRFGAKFSF